MRLKKKRRRFYYFQLNLVNDSCVSLVCRCGGSYIYSLSISRTCTRKESGTTLRLFLKPVIDPVDVSAIRHDSLFCHTVNTRFDATARARALIMI